MTLILTLKLKIAFLDFVAAGGILRVSQSHLDISLMMLFPLFSSYTKARIGDILHNACHDKVGVYVQFSDVDYRAYIIML